jgi:hypothetical protein
MVHHYIGLASVLALSGGCVAGEAPFQDESEPDTPGPIVATAGADEQADAPGHAPLARSISPLRSMPITRRRIPFDCRVSGDNRGCSKQVWCPSGVIVGAVAACNLESGAVSDEDIRTLPIDLMVVVQASDNVSSGVCQVGGNRISKGSRPITGLDGRRSVKVKCEEHDRNGGDCHIRGVLYCGER